MYLNLRPDASSSSIRQSCCCVSKNLKVLPRIRVVVGGGGLTVFSSHTHGTRSWKWATKVGLCVRQTTHPPTVCVPPLWTNIYVRENATVQSCERNLNQSFRSQTKHQEKTAEEQVCFFLRVEWNEKFSVFHFSRPLFCSYLDGGKPFSVLSKHTISNHLRYLRFCCPFWCGQLSITANPSQADNW